MKTFKKKNTKKTNKGMKIFECKEVEKVKCWSNWQICFIMFTGVYVIIFERKHEQITTIKLTFRDVFILSYFLPFHGMNCFSPSNATSGVLWFILVILQKRKQNLNILSFNVNFQTYNTHRKKKKKTTTTSNSTKTSVSEKTKQKKTIQDLCVCKNESTREET